MQIYKTEMYKEKRTYNFHLNISVILMTFLLGAIVISTVTEYSEFAKNQTHLVDCEEDGDSKESETKDLNHSLFYTDLVTIDLGVETSAIPFKSMDIRYGKIPTTPPEL